MTPPLLAVEGISKHFGGIQALSHVTLDIQAGEVLAICGENGAGKSTLVKILMGIYQSDTGSIFSEGKEVKVRSPADGQALGIALVSQELSLAPDLSVADNIWLGSSRVPLFHRREALRRRAADTMAMLGFGGHFIDRQVASLSLAERQLVEIARNLCRDARVLILDEPTAMLSDGEIERTFAAIRRLRSQGTAIVYITHRLGEVFSICDRATVLRNGQVVGSAPTGDLSRERLVEMMIGRKLENVYPASRREFAEPLLAVRALRIPGVVDDVALTVRRGEIVGIAGQIGSGAADVIRALAGLVPDSAGAVEIGGKRIALGSRSRMLAAGIAFISEDRGAEGLFLKREVRENLVASRYGEFSRAGVIHWRKLTEGARRLASRVGIDFRRLLHKAEDLSGGNQQKIAFGRCVDPPKSGLVLMNEPTRGVDVGARTDIYTIMRGFCEQGFGLLMHSTDLEELLGMSDVVLTLYRGRLVGRYDRDRVDLQRVLADITHADSHPVTEASAA